MKVKIIPKNKRLDPALFEDDLPGRPTKYKSEYDKLANNYCWLGATNVQLAKFFEVAESTIWEWMQEHPTFSSSIKQAREDADAAVIKTLYKRALGYDIDVVTESVSDGVFGEQTTKTKTKKHIPGEVIAQMFWLKNRRPDLFKDRKHVDATITEKKPLRIGYTNLTDDDDEL